MTSAVGQRILGKYEIVRLLGTGSRATVYLARDMMLDRLLALKHYQLAIATEHEREALISYFRELRILASIRHQNIATIYSLEQAEDDFYLAMEYAEAGSLRELLAERGPLPVPMALEIATGICQALDIAHSRGVIHRDIKPSNILLFRLEEDTLIAKLADFGLALGPALEDRMIGMLLYAAPEQIAGEPVDERTDIYALGVVLYEMLLGHAPFAESTDTAQLIAAIREQTPIRPSQVRQDIPKELDKTLLIALSKSPERRYQRAKDMCDALRSALDAHRRAQLAAEHYERGLAQVQQGQWEEAIANFESVLKLQPGSPGAAERLDQARHSIELARLYEQGLAYFNKRAWKRAVEALEKVLELNATYKDASKRLAEVRRRSSLDVLYQEALDYESSGQWSEARSIYLEILRSTPDYRGVVVRLKRASTAEQTQVLLRRVTNYFERRATRKVAAEVMKLLEMISSEFETVSLCSEGDIHLFALYKPSPPMSTTLFSLTVPVLFLGHKQLRHKDLGVLRHFLTEHFGLSTKIGLLLLLSDERSVRDTRNLLAAKMRRPFAFDIVVVGNEELFQIAVAHDPKQALRQQVLSSIDLNTVSPFVVTGPTPDSIFFGRESEIREIAEHTATKSYAIIGGRRIGKSSLLNRLHHVRLPAAGFRTSYHDCSATPTYDAFFAAAIHDWRPKPPLDVPTTYDDLLQSPPTDKPLVLLLDEADKLVPADRANSWPLFNALRALANSGCGQIVLSGERTLRDALRDPKSPLFNFADEMLLGPLDFRAVEELVTRPMKQLEIELVDKKAIVDMIWDFTSGHPNVVQRLCRRLIERLNELGTRRITLADVNAIIEDPAFQRDDFLSTYWEAATPLERIISLLMADDENMRTLRAVRQALAERCDLQSKAREVDDALQRLVDLRSILKRTPTGYEFAVEAFPRVVAGTMTLDDMLEILTEEYQEQGE